MLHSTLFVQGMLNSRRVEEKWHSRSIVVHNHYLRATSSSKTGYHLKHASALRVSDPHAEAPHEAAPRESGLHGCGLHADDPQSAVEH